MADLTPVLRQYHLIKSQYKDAMLLFRLGDFYEMFCEDAVTASKALEITLTARHRGTENETPMCGFPAKAASSYIEKLLKCGFKVAVCEQLGDPETSKGPVERDVIRVITPGTAIEEELLDEKSNSFIASIYPTETRHGAALIDLSTGEFNIVEADTLEELLDSIAQMSPREIIYPVDSPCKISIKGEEETAYTTLPAERFKEDAAEKILQKHFGESFSELGFKEMPYAGRASGALLSYLEENLKRPLSHLKEVKALERSYMFLDSPTWRNLEIFKNLADGGAKGTLLAVLDGTKTAMGGRLLKQWISRPLLKKEEIDARLDAVSEWIQKESERENIREILSRVADMERIAARIALSATNARELLALKNSLTALPEIFKIVSTLSAPLNKSVCEKTDLLEDIFKIISDSIADSPPIALKEGGIIRDGYDPALDERRALKRDVFSYLSDLEARERKATGIETLRVGYNRVHGYYIEISKGKSALAPSRYDRRQTTIHTERFITPELKEYEAKLLNAEEWMKDYEYKLFTEIREKIAKEVARLKSTARALAQLDVLTTFADNAVRGRYSKPELNEGTSVVIRGGRHPVVEKMLGATAFVPNDLHIDNKERQILLITGPNMGGKSTYLRQTALIVLMAQTGSYVPADSAQIGVVDRIFTRVGASDNLARGLSTFMMEMTETANILKSATPRSLIILDEVGRGTSTFDGLSLAWAIVEHIHEREAVSAKTLFATHYLELTELGNVLSRVENMHFTAREWRDKVIFLRKIAPGAADRSYGIHVAQLAGLPTEVITRAKEVLKNLEENTTLLDGMPALMRGAHRPHGAKAPQPSLFVPSAKTDAQANAQNEIWESLAKLDLEQMTPIEALNYLARLKENLK